MKRVAGSFAVLAVTAAGLVAAQTTSPPTPPSDRSAYPSNSSPSTTSGNYSSTGKSHDQQMKDCVTQQQANNPSMSKSDIKKACKSQLSNSSSGNPHQ